MNGYRFHLADDTGKILIDAHAAEYDLPLATTREVDFAVVDGVRIKRERCRSPAVRELFPDPRFDGSSWAIDRQGIRESGRGE